jgi:hypothetical protein
VKLHIFRLWLGGIVLAAVVSGCRDTPAPQRVPVPSQNGYTRGSDEMRPLPPPSYSDPGEQPPFDDPPLLSQRPPEQRAFVDAYRGVGSPRVTLLVNRMLSNSPASIDYTAVETIMTDWLACNGQVTIISPTMADKQSADVLVQVQAEPTNQTSTNSIRMVADAVNTRGGESIGRAVVDVPTPLDKAQINDYTRYLARKLMDDMTQTWAAAPVRDHRPATAPSGRAPLAN